MATPQVIKMAERLRRHAREHATLEAARAALEADMEDATGEPLTEKRRADIAAAFEIVRKEETEVEVLRSNSMFDARPQWYSGPKVTDTHWPALKGYLVNSKGWSEDTVGRVIGNASTEIVSLLDDPTKDAFTCRGLVIGYVQSGKTANMTAVIAKAMDAGYNFVLVLAGLTNKLRQQTQRRLEADVVARERQLWQLLTSDDDRGDFRGLANGGFFVPKAPFTQIAVVKKNVAPLKRLITAINRTPPADLKRMKVLVIDDEADQASVNSSSKELDMTRINELIRQLLHSMPCVSYVGYTATPFANVFINPYGANGDLDDLYPKDFITALERPDGYFGAEQLFGREPADPGNPLPEEEGLDVIRTIPDEEVASIQPNRRDEKDAFKPVLPSSLESATLWFLASCATRRARGQTDQHMSMLVHTSSFVVMHDKVASLIDSWIQQNKSMLLKSGSEVQGRLRAVWESEQARLPADITTARHVPWEEVLDYLTVVLDELQIVIENGLSTDRIDYSGPPRTYIVVGGSVLARGLTLEGLMVSYFLRTSSQYDTLLQMGRWFGYRGGYEDLPRIWTTSGLTEAFRALAAIELEIRDDVVRYFREQVSPMEFAVRVRAIPGMAITAASKMRAAVACDISYSGKHVQTIHFDHKDKQIACSNWLAASELVEGARKSRRDESCSDRALFTDVPRNVIVKFLREYSISSSHGDLKPEFLLGYVNSDAANLDLWNVGVVTGGGRLSSNELGGLGRISTVIRSRLITPEEPANIKALMSRQDVMFDCPDSGFDKKADWSALKMARLGHVGNRPLLLLYPIEQASVPRRGKSRAPLDACGDQIGIGIVFPGSVAGAGGYYRVNLDPPDSEDLDDIEAEVNEMEALERGAQEP
jgi:hypothetical protein